MPDITITIVGMNGALSFSPPTATVRVGQRVIWTNADSTAHTATGNGFDTGPIDPGRSSVPILFSAPGNVPYRCTIHPTMTGLLTVTQ